MSQKALMSYYHIILSLNIFSDRIPIRDDNIAFVFKQFQDACLKILQFSKSVVLGGVFHESLLSSSITNTV